MTICTERPSVSRRARRPWSTQPCTRARAGAGLKKVAVTLAVSESGLARGPPPVSGGQRAWGPQEGHFSEPLTPPTEPLKTYWNSSTTTWPKVRRGLRTVVSWGAERTKRVTALPQPWWGPSLRPPALPSPSPLHPSRQLPPKSLELRAGFVLQGLGEGLVQDLQPHFAKHQLCFLP